jgi:regulator of Ty1 transposition protein 103
MQDVGLANMDKIVVEATATAYKGATNDIQQKIRRVTEVWRQRNVFEGPILEAVETRVNGRSFPSHVHSQAHALSRRDR